MERCARAKQRARFLVRYPYMRHLTPNSFVWFHVLPVVGVVLTLITYWFAVADRYIIFLYYHGMGPLVPDTSPFSEVTRSRYWMSGLVAAGVVMVLYSGACWLLGRLSADYHPPSWWLTWIWTATVLAVGIPLITATVNQPPLPLGYAAQVMVTTLTGLALALVPGSMAARRPIYLLGLALDGTAVMIILYFCGKLDSAGRWWTNGDWWRAGIIIGGVSVGIAGLLIMTALRIGLRREIPGTITEMVAGLNVFLLLPLVHYLFVGIIDGYFYISNAANFFASTVWYQAFALLLTALFVWLVTQLRRYLVRRIGEKAL